MGPETGDPWRGEDRRQRLDRPRLAGHRRHAGLVPVGADAPHRLAGEHPVGGFLDPLDLILDVFAHVPRVPVRPATTDARYALLRLPGPDGLHPVGRLLRLLPVHRRADADLELAHPAVSGCHGSVGIPAGSLERIDEWRPARTAATGESIGLVGEHAIDLALPDQVEQLAELRPVAATVSVARRRWRLDQLGNHVELQPGSGLTTRLDLHVQRRGALPRDRLPRVDRGSTPKGRRRRPAIRARVSRGSHDRSSESADDATRAI